ncbi:hypothetical protein AAY473_013582 [Plecturocebus cupreus]
MADDIEFLWQPMTSKAGSSCESSRRCFLTTVADTRSCDKDHKAHKSKMSTVSLYRKSSPIPV